MIEEARSTAIEVSPSGNKVPQIRTPGGEECTNKTLPSLQVPKEI